jgi:hypothetical protein
MAVKERRAKQRKTQRNSICTRGDKETNGKKK